jgi:hypothetical protein
MLDVHTQVSAMTWVACVLAAAAATALAWLKPGLRGTTLVAPWYWSSVSLLSISLAEVLVGMGAGPSESKWVAALRFGSAMSTFCPLMALLGAKRPQDRAWQAIVLSLWLILCLPAGEWLLFGGVAELHPLWFWFLAILTLWGAANWLATRWWLAGTLVCMGQLALVAPFLSTSETWLSAPRAPIVALAALAAAGVLVAAGLPRPRRAASPVDRAWLDFRDHFGVVWGLRVAQRINASAEMYDWPVVLSWGGFCRREDGQPVGEVPAETLESLRTLLRRFVSPAWLDQRLAAPADPLKASIP